MFPPKKKKSAPPKKAANAAGAKNPIDKSEHMRNISQKSKRLRQSESIGKHLMGQM